MYGKNPIRKPVSGDGQSLEVKHIFPTLQGEGPHVGVPSVFVRLGGCNLACDFCDTDFEDYATLEVSEILDQVEKFAKNAAGKCTRHLVVITGGEPLRQPIAPLCEALLAAGFQVQIETNGTLFRPLPAAVEVICSPKNTGGVYAPIRADLLERITALKFIVSASHPHYQTVPDWGAPIPIFVQPMDEKNTEKNATNRAYATQLALQHGYRLSLQTHKILGIE